MPKHPHELASATSLVLLQPLLAALNAADTAILKPASSLPMPCFHVASMYTLLCATPINSLPVFRAAMISAAALNKVDVVVVKHGLAPEVLDDVTIDVVTGRTRSVQMLWDLGRYRAVNGSSWLVPPAGGAGPSVRIDAAGLTLVAEPPYADLDERGDGLARAARETVLAMRRLRSPR
ncbi:hypothetical protein HZF05_07335 [Sphingomonas sp. CGMCC 1.13654]|uniref:Uncharacterized protein n=1 Tax=Sphingomonas chungangi TaxID=2683589 RepID=A0A838L5M0_9SPHN|nr:hypothetical protein [Sphingomonas chungangi]MBA2933912.1 hypothetical protein [Sphingomonas chungangi]MVW55241.1 hypothetical protein [Sphingomonas chungangi]